MNHLRPLSVGSLLLAFSLPGLPPEQELEAIEQQGSLITRRFEVTTESAQQSMSISIDGEEMDPERMRGMGGSSTESMALEVLDAVLEAEDDRATSIRRTYGEVSRSGSRTSPGRDGEERETPLDAASPLNGEDVLVVVEDGEAQVSLPEGSSLEEETIEGLTADLSCRWLLPEGPVEVGASWEIDAAHAQDFLFPGGDLKLMRERSEDEGGWRRRRGGALEDLVQRGGRGGMGGAGLALAGMELEGDIQATFEGVSEEDENLVRIVLTFDLSGAKDLTEDMDGGEGRGFQVDASDREVALEGDGFVLWNLELGRLDSYEITFEVSQEDSSEMTMQFGDESSRTMERNSTVAGTVTSSATVSAE